MFERREERRAHLKTNRKDEQNQAKLLNKLQCIHIDGQPQVAGKDTHKENKGSSKRDTFNFNLAQHNS